MCIRDSLGAVELTGPGEITPHDRGVVPYDYTVYSSVLCAESMRFYWLTYRNSRVRYVELSRLLAGDRPLPVSYTHLDVYKRQALLGDPAFLIFDEPTVGLDPEERIHFRNLFSRLAQDRLVLLSTHIIEDVQSVCSRLLVLHQGRLRFDGTPEELIRAAEGHVGTFEARAGGREDGLHITARVNTARGVACRAVAETLPPYVRPAEPTLEDAYLYLCLLYTSRCV